MGERKTIWDQMVEAKAEWIGGTLEELSSGYPTTGGGDTAITDIEIEPNGESRIFWVRGKKFDCGFDIRYGGVIPGEDGWLTFAGYSGHRWRIRKPAKEDSDG